MIADRKRLRAFLLLSLEHPERGLLARLQQLDDVIVDGASNLLCPPARADAHASTREAVRAVLASARDAVLFRRHGADATAALILTATQNLIHAGGARRVPASYAELRRLCR